MWALALLLPIAAAVDATPPDTSDPLAWEQSAYRLVELPEGCWEWVGKVSWDWDFGRRGGTRGDALFVGRTIDGVWSSIHMESLGEISRDDEDDGARVYRNKVNFAPLVGRLRGGRVTLSNSDEVLDEGAQATNLLRSYIEWVAGDAETASAQWDEARDAVRLHQSIDLEGNGDKAIDVSVTFPNGDLFPTQIDMLFPQKFRVGRLLSRRTVRNATVRIRGTRHGDLLFPTSEALSLSVDFFGFSRLHGAQSFTWKRVTRCSG